MAQTRPRESAVDRIRQRVEEKAARRAAAAKAEAGPPHPDPNRPPPGAPSPQELPGIHAEKPTDIPLRGLEADRQAGVGREQGRQHADHRRRCRLLRLPVDLPGPDRDDLPLRPGRLPRDGDPPDRGPLRAASAERRGPHRDPVAGDHLDERQRPDLESGRGDPRRALERLRWRREHRHRGQPGLRRGRDAELLQAEGHLAAAHARRDRVRADHLRARRRRPDRAGRSAAGRRRNRSWPRCCAGGCCSPSSPARSRSCTGWRPTGTTRSCAG